MTENTVLNEMLEEAVGSVGRYVLNSAVWVQNSSVGSVLGLLSCLMQCRWFDPPLRRIFSEEGIFPLELTWVRTLFPRTLLGLEYKLRSSLCTHVFHHTDSRDPDIRVLNG